MDWGQPDVDDLDPWQLRCPNGHTSFEPVDGHWFCQRCHRNDRFPTDGRFEHLHDARTGEKLDRETVREVAGELDRADIPHAD